MTTKILTRTLHSKLIEYPSAFFLLSLIGLSLCLIRPVPVTGNAGQADLVLFLQEAEAPVIPLELLGGIEVRLLNSAGDGRQVATADLPSNWQIQLGSERSHSAEWLVLDGELNWDGEKLGTYDFAYLPSGATAPAVSAGDLGARILVFLDPPRETDGVETRLVMNEAIPWRPGVVAKQDTGLDLQLEVKDLLWVESTGQRTWLLRAGPDLKVPWEVHDGAEEGYLLEGEYRLAECLDSGPVTGSYTAGGYFYRPGGIVHSGPESGTQSNALWLLRTPTRLTVEFVNSCPR